MIFATLLVCWFYPTPNVSCMQARNLSYSMTADTTFRMFPTQLVFNEHFLNKLN